MRSKTVCVPFLFIVLLLMCTCTAEEADKEPDPTDATALPIPEMKGKIHGFELYKKLFTEQRAFMLDAVKGILKFEKYEQQYSIVSKMMDQMFKILEEGRQNLTLWGYIPGDSFTHNETLKHAVSNILENTALFGDMVLRLPDMVHSLYDKNREWQIIMGWAVMFSTESKVFEGSSAKLLDLMSQELGLIAKREDYINPFKEEELLKAHRQAGLEGENKREKKKKKTKEKRKGPRLSGIHHTEL